jgi:peroxiredoxin-like protein
MKPLPHHYEVTLSGEPTGYATLSSEGVPPLRSAPPKDFDGPGDAWGPEHLLLAAVATCFMFTFRAVAQASKFAFTALDLSGSGTVDRKDGGTRFTEITLRTRLKLPAGGDPERAKRILEKGKNSCLVTTSLLVAIELEMEILIEP